MNKKQNLTISDCIDKEAIEEVLGSLMREPLLFKEGNLKEEDFGAKFYKNIFKTLKSLYLNKALKLDPVTVDKMIMSSVDTVIKDYTENSGREYLINAYNRCTPENFKYYYNIVKKYSLLRELVSNKFNIKNYFSSAETDEEKLLEKTELLNNSSFADIINSYRNKLSEILYNYDDDEEKEEIKAGEGMYEIIEQNKKGVLYGVPYSSEYYTQITHGMKEKKFSLLSAGTGMGKTRLSISNVGHSFSPYFYNSKEEKWQKNPYVLTDSKGVSKVGVLYIGTEMDLKTEINPILTAYISNVPETHIKEGVYEEGEEERVKIASEIMLSYSNIYFANMPEYSMEKLDGIVAKYKNKYNIKHVFLDYIMATSALMKEYGETLQNKNMASREDQVLLILSAFLKNLSRKYNISIDSWTQTNSDVKSEDNRDSGVIRGAKAIADKVDVGGVVTEPTAKELAALKEVQQAYLREHRIVETENGKEGLPNVCISIYKNRGGEYKNIKIWLRVDYSTMRTHDLYVTTYNGVLINKLKKKRYISYDYKNNVKYSILKDDKPPFEEMPESIKKSIKVKLDKRQKMIEQDSNELTKIAQENEDEELDFRY